MTESQPHPLTRLGNLTFQATDETLEQDVRALVTPDARFRINGHNIDIDGFLAHLRELRSTFTEGTMTVIEEFVDGSGDSAKAAARVVVRMRLRDGSTGVGESHILGTIAADGRVAELIDLGRFVQDGDDDPAAPLRY